MYKLKKRNYRSIDHCDVDTPMPALESQAQVLRLRMGHPAHGYTSAVVVSTTPRYAYMRAVPANFDQHWPDVWKRHVVSQCARPGSWAADASGRVMVHARRSRQRKLRALLHDVVLKAAIAAAVTRCCSSMADTRASRSVLLWSLSSSFTVITFLNLADT